MTSQISLKEQRRTEKPKNIFFELAIILSITMSLLFIVFIVFKKT